MEKIQGIIDYSPFDHSRGGCENKLDFFFLLNLLKENRWVSFTSLSPGNDRRMFEVSWRLTLAAVKFSVITWGLLVTGLLSHGGLRSLPHGSLKSSSIVVEAWTKREALWEQSRYRLSLLRRISLFLSAVDKSYPANLLWVISFFKMIHLHAN